MPIDVFFLYSPKDEGLRDELEAHLAALRKHGILCDWHDRRVGAGDDRRAMIEAQLASARVFLLLVSADLLASDEGFDADLRRALERHRAGEARLIPILLRACSYEEAPFAGLEALPRGGRPVTSWPNRDEAWREVVEGIRDVVEELGGPLMARRSPALRRRALNERRERRRGLSSLRRASGRGSCTRGLCQAIPTRRRGA